VKSNTYEYLPATWAGENTSGLRPFGKNLLVRVDETPKTSGGGVMFTDQMLEQLDAQSVTGCVYAVGPEAFRQFDDGHPWQGDKPAIGERIYFEKFAGTLARGKDGAMYRVMDYRAVAAGYLDPADGTDASIEHKGA
jgi:chaperonin GroES